MCGFFIFNIYFLAMNELLLCQNTNIKHVGGNDDDEDKISGPHLINSDSINLLNSKCLLYFC